MQEIFYEETVNDNNPAKSRKRYLAFKILSIFFYVIAVVFLILCWVSCYSTPSEELSIKQILLGMLLSFFVPSILFFIMGFYCGKIKFKFAQSFDYTFVSGEIRIAKVLNGVKRKPVIKFGYDKIYQIGKVGSESFEKLASVKENKKIICTPNNESEEGKEFYYLAITHEGTKKLVIIESKELFLVNILKFASKTVLEKDFIKKTNTEKA